MISKAIGEKVEYEPLAQGDYITRMTAKGWPKTVAEHTVELYQLVMEGREEEISPDVERVLGRRPRRLENFINEHKGQFI